MGKVSEKLGITLKISLSIFVMLFIFIGMNTMITNADENTTRGVTTITSVDGATSTVTTDGYVDINVEVDGTGLNNIKSTKLYTTDTTTGSTYKSSVQVTNFTETELDFSTEFQSLNLNHEYTVEYSMIASDDEEFRGALTSSASLDDETVTLENGNIVSLKTNENDEISFIKEGEVTEITSVDGVNSVITPEGYVDINVDVVGTGLENLTSARIITTDTTTGSIYRNSIQVTNLTDTEASFTTEFQAFKVNHAYTVEYEMTDTSGEIFTDVLTSSESLDLSQNVLESGYTVWIRTTGSNNAIEFGTTQEEAEITSVDGKDSIIDANGNTVITVDLQGTGLDSIKQVYTLTTDTITGKQYTNTASIESQSDSELVYKTTFESYIVDHPYTVAYKIVDGAGTVTSEVLTSSVELDETGMNASRWNIYLQGDETNQITFGATSPETEGEIYSVIPSNTEVNFTYDYKNGAGTATDADAKIVMHEGNDTSGVVISEQAATEGTAQKLNVDGLEANTTYTIELVDETGTIDAYTFTTTTDPVVISDGNITDTNETTTTATITYNYHDTDSVATNETLTLYDVNGDVVDTIVATEGNGQTVTFSGLEANTTYKVVLTDSNGKLDEATFTTKVSHAGEGYIVDVDPRRTNADVYYNYEPTSGATDAHLYVYTGTETTGTPLAETTITAGDDQVWTIDEGSLVANTAYTVVMVDSTGQIDILQFTTDAVDSTPTGISTNISTTAVNIVFQFRNNTENPNIDVNLYTGTNINEDNLVETYDYDDPDVGAGSEVPLDAQADSYAYSGEVFLDHLDPGTEYTVSLKNETGEYILDTFTTKTNNPLAGDNQIGYVPFENYDTSYYTGGHQNLDTGIVNTCPNNQILNTVGAIAVPKDMATGTASVLYQAHPTGSGSFSSEASLTTTNRKVSKKAVDQLITKGYTPDEYYYYQLSEPTIGGATHTPDSSNCVTRKETMKYGLQSALSYVVFSGGNANADHFYYYTPGKEIEVGITLSTDTTNVPYYEYITL